VIENEARRLVIEGIDIMMGLQHQGALDANAQDTLNKLNELSTALICHRGNKINRPKGYRS
jgi:hypothetical protein